MNQPTYRISVTTLESFRRYLAEASSFDTEESLIETIKGLFTGNDKTRTGSAFHKIIEDPKTATTVEKFGKHWQVSEGIAFPMEVAEQAAIYRMQHPSMIHEVPLTKIYETKKHRVMVSGRVDGMEGMVIRDAKTKFRGPTVTEYQDSFQWRYYLDAFGLQMFYYDIFEVKSFKDLLNVHDGIFYLEDITMTYHEPIPCTYYMSMHSDCLYLLTQFMDYIENRNFFHYLKTTDAQATIL